MDPTGARPAARFSTLGGSAAIKFAQEQYRRDAKSHPLGNVSVKPSKYFVGAHAYPPNLPSPYAFSLNNLQDPGTMRDGEFSADQPDTQGGERINEAAMSRLTFDLQITPPSRSLSYTRGRSIELDFLRGIAILLVALSHYSYPKTNGPLDWVGETFKSVGGIGVDLFFTLSGFLVGGLLFHELRTTGAIRVRRFLARRAMKLWPGLYALLMVHLVIGRHPVNTFFWQNLFHVQNYFGTSLAQTWSLAVEEHFYIFLSCVLAISAGISRSRLMVVLISIGLVSMVARDAVALLGDLDAAFSHTPYRIESLIYGVILAAVHQYYPEHFSWIARKKHFLIASTIALSLFAYCSEQNLLLVRTIGYSIHGICFSLIIVLACAHSGSACKHFAYRATAWIGIYSYGIYLWHSVALSPGQRAIALMHEYSFPPSLAWLLAIAGQLILAIACGYAATRIVEWPFLKIRERWFPPTIRSELLTNSSDPERPTTKLSTQ